MAYLQTFLIFCPFLLFGVLMIGGAVALMALIVISSRRRTVQLHEVWAAFAQTHGLSFDKGDFFRFPQMTGEYNGRPVSIRIESRQIVRSSRYYTVLQTSAGSAPGAQVMISRKDTQLYIPGFVRQAISGVGDEMFRSMFDAAGNAPDLAARLAAPAITTALVTEGIGHLAVIGQQASFYINGFEERAERIAKLLDLLYTIAGQIP